MTSVTVAGQLKQVSVLIVLALLGFSCAPGTAVTVDADGGSHDAATVFTDASTDASTELPDASTGLPDASTGLPDASTGLPDASTGLPDASTPMTDGGQPATARSITQYGITWTWDELRPIGQFANGDYWVVGPIRLVGISPASVPSSSASAAGVLAHGSMINPISSWWPDHGFDSRIGGYTEALNIARQGGAPLSPTNSRVVPAGSSICSSTSRLTATAAEHSLLNDFAVLTVVDTPPAAGSFRPPYIGADKTVKWNKSQLDYSLLRNLAPVAGMHAPTSSEFVRPWLLISTQYNAARDFSATNNQVEYDRDMAWAIGGALLELHQNYPNAQKELAYVRIVQYGIDMYGAVKFGVLRVNGTDYPVIQENTGPKAAVVLAALTLNDADMKFYANAANQVRNPYIGGGQQPTPRWGPDSASAYVSVADVGAATNDQYLTEGRPRYTFTSQMVGLPEWTNIYASNWGVIYRDVRYGGVLGPALGMQLTPGAKALWNWPAFFDYIDRARATYRDSSDDPALDYVKLFWDANRATVGSPLWTRPAPISGIGWIPTTGDRLTIEYTDNVSIGAGGSGGLTLTTSGAAVTATLSSTLGPDATSTAPGKTQRVYALSRVIAAGETISYSYSQPGNGIEALTGGADVASASGVQVVNYSTR